MMILTVWDSNSREGWPNKLTLKMLITQATMGIFTWINCTVTSVFQFTSQPETDKSQRMDSLTTYIYYPVLTSSK
jgi:hypothetical protein